MRRSTFRVMTAHEALIRLGRALGRGSTSKKGKLRAVDRARVRELDHRRAHVGRRSRRHRAARDGVLMRCTEKARDRVEPHDGFGGTRTRSGLDFEDAENLDAVEGARVPLSIPRNPIGVSAAN